MSAYANSQNIAKLLTGVPKVLWCSNKPINSKLAELFCVIKGDYRDNAWFFDGEAEEKNNYLPIDCTPVNCHAVIVDTDIDEKAVVDLKSIWSLPEQVPPVLPSTTKSDALMTEVCAHLMRQNKELAGGYVQLRNQINELRREVEHTRVQHFDLEGYVNSLRMDRPRLAYTAAPSGKYIGDTNLSSDVKLRQLLPFRAKGIYGIDLNFLPTKNIGKGALHVRLIAQEDDAVLASWELNYDDCDGWVHFFFNAPCDMKYRFVDIEVSWITYSGKSPRLSLALTNQDEAALRTVAGPHPGQMLAFKVWIATPGTALRPTPYHHFPVSNDNGVSYALPADAALLAKLQSTVPPASVPNGFAWYNIAQPKDIFIHPLPNIASTLVVPMAFDSKVSMITSEVFNSHEQGPEIEFLLCATPAHLYSNAFPHKELNEHGNSIDPQIFSTGWVTTYPDQLPHALVLNLGIQMKSFNLHLAARSRKTVDYAHGHFQNTEVHFSRNSAKCL